MKRFAYLLCVFAAFSLTGAENKKGSVEPLRFEASIDAMGSTYIIVAYDSDRARLQNGVGLALEEARRLDQLLSNYRPESEWSKVNREAADHPVKLSDELFRLLSACVEYSRKSEGAFDISVGPLMKIWGFYKGSGHLPHRAEVRTALAKVGYQHLQLDPQNRTIQFTEKGVEIDPGGIGKGYAVDRMADVLRQQGIHSALISAGSSSIYALGTPPDEPKGWRIEIRDPKIETKVAQVLYLKDQSLSTSGNYEKFFRAEGRVYAHIMDPRTGFPAVGMLSASVVAPRTLDSEAWTKPYFIQGRKWAANHLQPGFRVFLCEDRTDTPCAWLR